MSAHTSTGQARAHCVGHHPGPWGAEGRQPAAWAWRNMGLGAEGTLVTAWKEDPSSGRNSRLSSSRPWAGVGASGRWRAEAKFIANGWSAGQSGTCIPPCPPLRDGETGARARHVRFPRTRHKVVAGTLGSLPFAGTVCSRDHQGKRLRRTVLGEGHLNS